MDLGPTLVIRPGALGDAILTLPALHALRLSGARVSILGTPASWGFAKVSHDGLRVCDFGSADWLGLFSKGVPLGDSARATLSQIRTAIVYLNDAADIAATLKQSGVQTVITAAPPVEVSSSAAHAADMLLAAAAPLLKAESALKPRSLLTQGADPFINVDDDDRNRALDRIGLDDPPPGGFLGIHPGSGGKRKCWSVKSFAQAAVKISCETGITPLVFFGPADDHLRDEFEAAVPPGVNFEAATGRPLREVLALLSLCHAYVGNDSGVTHLAARACPTAAIFGPTDPAVWAPLGERVTIVRAPGNDLSRLNPDTVIDALIQLL